MDKSQRRLNYFNEQLHLTGKMASVLVYSYQQVAAMEDRLNRVDYPWTAAEATELEALSARFARLADMLIQKLFRALDALELVDEGSLLDRLARMEKRRIIDSMETWSEIRELRNQIAHDYVATDLLVLQRSVFQNCPLLLAALEALSSYALQRGWIYDAN